MTEQEVLTLVNTLLKQSTRQGQSLNDVESLVVRETWAGCSYNEIAKQSAYGYDYIKQVGSRLWKLLSQAIGEKVSKKNLRAALPRYQQSQQSAEVPAIQGKQDWGEAIDVSRFYGRQEELQTLETWILADCCRTIGIFGLGGIGKTALSIKLAQHIQRVTKGITNYLIASVTNPTKVA